jgi:hypothetical protein
MAETKTKTTAGKSADTGQEPPAATPGTASKEHVCNVAFCPIAMALTAVQGAAPDVLEHLLKAAQEFLLAARAVVDARAGDFDDGPDRSTLQKIEIS